MSDAIFDGYEEDYENCPVCGNVINYCAGHGPIGDPEGWAILMAHDNDDHSRCFAECA